VSSAAILAVKVSAETTPPRVSFVSGAGSLTLMDVDALSDPPGPVTVRVTV
jgi:hypothetical protein